MRARRRREKGAAAGTRGEELAEERGVDYADDGVAADDKGDADAEGGEEVDIVYGAVEGVDAPRGRVGDEVVAGGAFGVCFFADEAEQCELRGVRMVVFRELAERQIG